MRPVLEPSNIYAHRHEEQDVILWYNRALWHSIVSHEPTWSDYVPNTVLADRVPRIIWATNHAPV